MGMVGFYAGSFDPFTNGHLHVVKTASKFLDKVIIGIGINQNKLPRFDNNEMKIAIEKTIKFIKVFNHTLNITIFALYCGQIERFKI